MAASQNLSRLREQTMSSLEDEEAVTVNTRALIDKVLARYSGEWTTLRELIQNAADAQARKVTIRFETSPSATVPLPQSSDPAEHLKHTLLNHTVKTLVVSNDGEHFKETDWQRLKRIAEGNPDETKIGAFGVGFYSVFADCESPFVSSGNQSMAFYWKKDSLFTRRGKLSDSDVQGTTFLLDYRSQTTPVPQLLSICQFLATSLTFVGLESIELYLDQWNILTLNKKMAPAANVKIPSDVNPKTKDGLMKITDVEYQNAQIDAKWMNVVGWNRRPQSSAPVTIQQSTDTGTSLRSFFGRLTGGATASASTRKAQNEENALQQAILDDLAGHSTATVFLRISTVSILTNVSRQLSAELERATKKPPPKRTRISILTSSYDESAASMSSTAGGSSKKAADIFASVLPTKNGKIFIGFPTAQTTGLLAHISAPSVIPTVERESIDLNARYVRDWNVEMLRVAGIACRIAYTGDMIELRAKIDRNVAAAGRKKVTSEDISAVMPSAVHTYKQYNFQESTPSLKVGQYIEEAFWTCNQRASIDVLSTRGVLPSQQVRIATEDLSFVEGIPVVPDELMDKANEFLTKLRDYGLLSDITTGDIKKELEAQALTEKQLMELVKWACTKVSRQEMDSDAVQMLFDGTVASVSEEFVSSSGTPVLQLGQINTFVNSAKIPVDLPTPPQTIPFRITKGLAPSQLQSIGWDELQIVPWLRWIVESDGSGFGANESLTSSPAVASQVLPVISKGWEALSQSSKQTVQELLIPRTVIPTKLGMRRPPQAYFGSVKLFDDLPTITGLQGVKEKFLNALGVRKTVELNVVFERLMAKSATGAADEGKWSHVELIKYLVSVKDDIPSEDMKRLQRTPICPAESRSGDQPDKGRLYRLAELFEPDDKIRRLQLPVLQWPGQYRASTPEGRFLRSLGLRPFPSVPDLVNILAKAIVGGELQKTTIDYWIANAYQYGYHKHPVAEIQTAFLPVESLPGEKPNMVGKPSQLYANPKASVLGFRVLRQDLQQNHALFGVALDPPIDKCADKLIRAPPANPSQAQLLFSYFAGRLSEIGPNGNLAERLNNAPIVPVVEQRRGEKASQTRFIAPRVCYLGNGETWADIFDFVDFGHEANTFLLRIGAKHEPNAFELAGMLVRQPGRLLETLGTEKYANLLRKIAENASNLKKDKALWTGLKSSSCLIAEKLVRSDKTHDDEKGELDDEEVTFKEIHLARATEIVIVDDITVYRIFQGNLLAAPQEEQLETLYNSLDTPSLSKLVETDQRMGALLRDQTPGAKLQKLLVERCRLFLHDHPSDVIRRDAKWLEQNLTVKVTEFLQITRRLKGFRGLQHTEKKTAALHQESKRDATLFVTARCDLYEVSRAVMPVLLKRPRQQDFLALETILESDLRRLKIKGYNVDRILRQKAAESRIAESERQKREEEQQRLAANDPQSKLPQQDQMPQQAPAAKSVMGPGVSHPESPDRTLSMPGSFGDLPERPRSPGIGKRPTGLFSNLQKALGLNSGGQASNQMQNLLSNDAPPPYEQHNSSGPRSVTPGTEVVTSPRDVHENLQRAIKSTREYNSSTVFNQPQTNNVKETTSYCDSKPGHDLKYAAELSNGIKLYLDRTNQDPNAFLQTHREAIALFVFTLSEVAKIFEVSTQTIHVFHDLSGASIAFNSSGSIFCNLRYFMQLHMPDMATPEGKVEALAYWYITLCHELAHNLVSNHDSNHSYYTESFAAHYFRRMVWLAGRVLAQQG
ncbi:Putative histidine kinase/HSP90-like ATPase superfamily [Septoria linicola]|uniref:Histidine kinase/HSP90-like ATPase superfamily n=1 Tax=Septoria linicola TaxID=215465 RepID=A0A9Q9AYY9_9PEZI|nr:putative histidine kinase/HSP90-like ATPase superfamily [Septoria linicola]USW53231.1 Putative histidine kinase/HSP90-like ATPase superfamily [Septoria linicola]